MPLNTLKLPMVDLLANSSPVDGDALAFNATSGEVEFKALSGVPAGGTTGQFLSKVSGTDGDVVWATASSAIPVVTTEYCPNYPISIDQDGNIVITGYDVSNIFPVGKSVIIKDSGPGGDIETTVTIVSGSSTSTTITFASGTVSFSAYDLCLKASAVGWSPIVGDPFLGTKINAITSGVIGDKTYWVIVGDYGKLAYSITQGQTWETVTTGTTEHLQDVAYNESDNTFLAVGFAGVLISSVDGVNWVLDTTSIARDTTYTGSNDLTAVVWEVTGQWWAVGYKYNSDSYLIAYANSVFTVWTFNINLSATAELTSLNLEKSATTDNLLITFSDTLYYSDGATDNSLKGNYSASTQGICNDSVDTNISSWAHFNIWSNGFIAFRDTSTVTYTWTTPEGLNAICYSPFLSRAIVVGNKSYIGAIEEADFKVGTTIAGRANGFDPLANITDIHRNDSEGYFIAVADNGQICRSNNGIS